MRASLEQNFGSVEAAPTQRAQGDTGQRTQLELITIGLDKFEVGSGRGDVVSSSMDSAVCIDQKRKPAAAERADEHAASQDLHLLKSYLDEYQEYTVKYISCDSIREWLCPSR
jgi:hypothetical protein